MGFYLKDCHSYSVQDLLSICTSPFKLWVLCSVKNLLLPSNRILTLNLNHDTCFLSSKNFNKAFPCIFMLSILHRWQGWWSHSTYSPFYFHPLNFKTRWKYFSHLQMSNIWLAQIGFVLTSSAPVYFSNPLASSKTLSSQNYFTFNSNIYSLTISWYLNITASFVSPLKTLWPLPAPSYPGHST